MRNILEYPITQDEKVSVLEGVIADLLKSDLIGDMRPAVLGAILNDIRPRKPEKATRRAPVPAVVEPGDVIPGPRVPLRYGSAATAIRLSTRQWRMVEHGDDNAWVGIDDYTVAENIIGKSVRFTVGGRTFDGVATPPQELDEALMVSVKGCQNAFGFYDVTQVSVLPVPDLPNMFEAVIADPELAKKCRLEMKHRIAATGSTLRARLLAEFGWTEEDLKEVA